MSPEFKAYSVQVRANAKAIAAKLISLGCSIATGGTDNHLVLWDLKPEGITGSKFEKICDACNITLNKNCVPGDKSAITPGGVRIGAPAMTTRKLDEADFEQIAVFLHEALVIAKHVQSQSGPKLADFIKLLKDNELVKELKTKVNDFATSFPMPGFNPKEMKYKK